MYIYFENRHYLKRKKLDGCQQDLCIKMYVLHRISTFISVSHSCAQFSSFHHVFFLICDPSCIPFRLCLEYLTLPAFVILPVKSWFLKSSQIFHAHLGLWGGLCAFTSLDLFNRFIFVATIDEKFIEKGRVNIFIDFTIPLCSWCLNTPSSYSPHVFN